MVINKYATLGITCKLSITFYTSFLQFPICYYYPHYPLKYSMLHGWCWNTINCAYLIRWSPRGSRVRFITTSEVAADLVYYYDYVQQVKYQTKLLFSITVSQLRALDLEEGLCLWNLVLYCTVNGLKYVPGLVNTQALLAVHGHWIWSSVCFPVLM